MNDTWKPWPKCPADDCHETEDVMIMECAPGYTYMITGGVCGHWVTLHRRPDTDMTDEEQRMWAEYFRPTDVPRETSPPANAHEALLALLREETQPSEEEWAAHMKEIQRRAGYTDDTDVPRETSEPS